MNQRLQCVVVCAVWTAPCPSEPGSSRSSLVNRTYWEVSDLVLWDFRGRARSMKRALIGIPQHFPGASPATHTGGVCLSVEMVTASDENSSLRNTD